MPGWSLPNMLLSYWVPFTYLQVAIPSRTCLAWQPVKKRLNLSPPPKDLLFCLISGGGSALLTTRWRGFLDGYAGPHTALLALWSSIDDSTSAPFAWNA